MKRAKLGRGKLAFARAGGEDEIVGSRISETLGTVPATAKIKRLALAVHLMGEADRGGVEVGSLGGTSTLPRVPLKTEESTASTSDRIGKALSQRNVSRLVFGQHGGELAGQLDRALAVLADRRLQHRR